MGTRLCCIRKKACGVDAVAPCHNVLGPNEDYAARRLLRVGVLIEGEESDAHQSCCFGAAVAHEVQVTDDTAAVP